MENHRLVLPEHLNHYGYLFGGQLLKWVDEIAWIAASLDYPGCKFVTVAMNKVEFKKSIKGGSILKFSLENNKIGNTSVQYAVTVFCDDIESGYEDIVFTTHITFVCLDSRGNKRTLTETTL